MDFWFELASPYSYLSAARIDALAEEHGVAVHWRPFLLGPIFKAQGWETSPFLIYPAKGKNIWRDIERRAAVHGQPYTPLSDEVMARFPPNTIAAARIALLGLDEDWGKAFVLETYRAEFVEHLDISDQSVLSGILERVMGDPEDALTRAFDPANKLRLRANTDEAIELGLFGAPAFTIGTELFWGDDRLQDALDWAANHA